ncbi:MAG: hypothetical protein NTW87_18625, partial [Planctomycetota bacterium]|nr:hypothetical protein [Planctomycetota bacterium]
STFRWLLETCLARCARYEEALAATDAVLELSPRDFSVRVLRLECLALLGRKAAALEYLAVLEKEHPEQAAQLAALRRALGAAGQGK